MANPDAGQPVYVGKRLSYDGNRCTVRYVGPVEGTDDKWYGVEWDDDCPKGKHDGTLNGKRYFYCFNDSPTAASFIRPTRRNNDRPLDFYEALTKKYASDHPRTITEPQDSIDISGKKVEEVGFDKIRKQLATLQELRIAILDGLCIYGIDPGQSLLDRWQWIRSQKLEFRELDLSRNLFESWGQILGICSALKASGLYRLKLDGNRFRNLQDPGIPEWRMPFTNVTHLSLNATRLAWSEVNQLLRQFPMLVNLSLSSNGIGTLSGSFPRQTGSSRLAGSYLRIMDLSNNKIRSFEDLAPLANLNDLARLSLRDNPLTELQCTKQYETLKFLDLTSTSLSTLACLDELSVTAPVLTALLTSHTPFASLESARLLTIARVPSLTQLNYTDITEAERRNAELYYLSDIAKRIGAATPVEADRIISQHRQWSRLCEIHGEPDIVRKQPEEAAAGTLRARVTEFTFYMTTKDWETGRVKALGTDSSAHQPTHVLDEAGAIQNVERKRKIPRTVDVYRLKGIVGQLFGIRPMSCILIWETGEWDPIGGKNDEEGWSVSEDDSGNEADVEGKRPEQKHRKSGRWEKRETELTDGTREVGFWIEGKTATVRVALR